MLRHACSRLSISAICLLSASVGLAQESQITFTKQVSQPGNTMVQQSLVHMDTVQSYEQSNQLISKTNHEVRKTQVRKIKTISTRPAIVQVTYTEAHLQEGKNRLFAKKKPQPVQRKSYRVTRAGDLLNIVDDSGTAPPPEELAIVQSTMDWVGRPNELAEFLNGRTVTLQQRIDLPADVAARMFGGKVGMGKIESAVLQLEKIEVIDGARCGVFAVELAGRTADSPIQEENRPIQLQGKISVQAATCRTAIAQVDSDVDVSEKRGPVGGQFTVTNRGKIRIAINAQFHEPSPSTTLQR